MKIYRGLGLQRYIEEDVKALDEIASSVTTKLVEDIKKDEKKEKQKRGRKKKTEDI